MYKLEIHLLEGEYWWGGIVNDGIYMPFQEQSIKRDLAKDQLTNQTSPFLLSSKGRYVWSDKPFQYHLYDKCLHIASEFEEIRLSDGHQNLKGAYKDASRRYFPPANRMPEAMLFTAPQYNGWIEMMYEPSQIKVLEYARGILNNGFPPGVLMIDDSWQEDYGVWKFSTEKFPNPKEMIDELHTMGFKVMLWICNYISPDCVTFRMLREKDLLIKDEMGTPVINEWWNGFSAILDSTNLEALDWIEKQLDRLMEELGVDGFKFDAGDLDSFHDYYQCKIPSLNVEYCEAWAKLGLKYTMNEYRACWKMAGQPLVQRLSDKFHSWSKENGLGSVIPNGLAQGLLGHSFICPDMIGGGEILSFKKNLNNLDQELFVRYAQCSALFPMMQFSAAPWRVLDQIHLSYCREAALLHNRMGEEIIKIARESSVTGEPILRHMAFSFPEAGYDTIIDQFMLGDDILVAPVIRKGETSREIRFPEGTWVGDDSSQVIGPCKLTVQAPLYRLPWYRRCK